jgi:hypothetical protein
MRKALLIALTSLCLSACALDPASIGKRLDASEPLHMYAGAHRAPQELSQISIVGQEGVATIESIDGNSRRGVSSGWSGYAFVYVLPGSHEIEVKYAVGGVLTSGVATNLVKLEERLDAGHTYALQFDLDRESKKVHFKLVDYGIDVPRHCVLAGIRDGGPGAPSFAACLRAPA